MFVDLKIIHFILTGLFFVFLRLTFFQTQDGSTTTFNEYDVDNDETAFHHHTNKISMTTSRTPEQQNSDPTENFTSSTFDPPLYVVFSLFFFFSILLRLKENFFSSTDFAASLTKRTIFCVLFLSDFRFADEEEFIGIAEPDSSGVSSDLICPTSTTSQRVS